METSSRFVSKEDGGACPHVFSLIGDALNKTGEFSVVI
jgi:hypothetical protein